MNISKLDENVYSFLVTSFNIYRHNYRKFVDTFLRGIEGNKRGLSGTDLESVNRLSMVVHILQNVKKDTLTDMRMFVERFRSNYRYIYVVDCLGLPDMYAVFYRAIKRDLMINLKTFVNIEGITAPFKKTFGSETMLQVATSLQGMVVKRLDTILHSDMFAIPYGREELVDALVSRMKYVETLIPLERDTLIVSDHGYDVIRKGASYFVNHGHASKLVLAKLAPVVLLKG